MAQLNLKATDWGSFPRSVLHLFRWANYRIAPLGWIRADARGGEVEILLKMLRQLSLGRVALRRLDPAVAAVHTPHAVLAHTDLLAMLPVQWEEFPMTPDTLQAIRICELLPAPAILVIRRPDLPLTPAAEHFCDLMRRVCRLGHEKPTLPIQRPRRTSAPAWLDRTAACPPFWCPSSGAACTTLPWGSMEFSGRSRHRRDQTGGMVPSKAHHSWKNAPHADAKIFYARRLPEK